MGYSRGTLNYPERITLFDPTHMMSMAGHLAIVDEMIRIENKCSLEKEFTELICMNP